jgi:hypothetical protein
MRFLFSAACLQHLELETACAIFDCYSEQLILRKETIMKHLIQILASLILLLAALSARASEEEFLDWTSAVIQVTGTPVAGDISCSVTVESGEWKEFTIGAFGKTYSLDETELAVLRGFPLSSLQTTHEQGYEELGGYTVHFRFEKVYYDTEGTLVTEIVYVSVNRLGMSVSEPRFR